MPEPLIQINSIVRNSDGAKFISLRDLRIFLLKSINLFKASNNAHDLIRAETLEELEKRLESIDT